MPVVVLGSGAPPAKLVAEGELGELLLEIEGYNALVNDVENPPSHPKTLDYLAVLEKSA